MKNSRQNLTSKHYFILLFLSVFGICPPSVSGQKIVNLEGHFPQTAVLKVSAGLFQPRFDGRNGMSVGMAYENAFANRLSWLVNTDLMFNPTDEVVLQKGNLRPHIQTRFTVQPEIRFYPTRVLKRWHVGLAAGFVGGFGKPTGQKDPDGDALLQSFTEEIFEVKIGWQQPFKKDFLWNVFASVGGFIPNKPIQGEARFVPMLRCGVLVGTQKQ